MARAEPAGPIGVVVVFCPRPGEVDAVELRLPAGATLRDAVRASGIAERHPGADPERAGIWGRSRRADALLRDGDRVELYRPLRVDPKEARRLRYRGQRESRARAKGAGADSAAASGSRSR